MIQRWQSFPVAANDWVGEVFDYVQGAKAFRLDFLDVWQPGVVRVEVEAQELDGILYQDGRSIDLEGGKGNFGFLFLNMTNFDSPDELRKPD